MDAMRRPQNIGRAELEILHFVQDHPPVTVREVADHISSLLPAHLAELRLDEPGGPPHEHPH